MPWAYLGSSTPVLLQCPRRAGHLFGGCDLRPVLLSPSELQAHLTPLRAWPVPAPLPMGWDLCLIPVATMPGLCHKRIWAGTTEPPSKRLRLSHAEVQMATARTPSFLCGSAWGTGRRLGHSSQAKLLRPPGPLSMEHVHSDKGVTLALASYSNSFLPNSDPSGVSLAAREQWEGLVALSDIQARDFQILNLVTEPGLAWLHGQSQGHIPSASPWANSRPVSVPTRGKGCHPFGIHPFGWC